MQMGLINSNCNSIFLKVYIKNKDDGMDYQRFYTYLDVRISNLILDAKETEYL